MRKLREHLDFAFNKATEEAKRRAAVHKQRYDAKARNSVLKPGGMVLVKNVGIRGNIRLEIGGSRSLMSLLTNLTMTYLFTRFGVKIRGQGKQDCFIASCCFLSRVFLA